MVKIFRPQDWVIFKPLPYCRNSSQFMTRSLSYPSFKTLKKNCWREFTVYYCCGTLISTSELLFFWTEKNECTVSSHKQVVPMICGNVYISECSMCRWWPAGVKHFPLHQNWPFTCWPHTSSNWEFCVFNWMIFLLAQRLNPQLLKPG